MPDSSQILRRIRAEYVEIPGLRLTLEQARRLFGVEQELCKVLLDGLVDAKLLYVTSCGAYARLTPEDRVPGRRTAKMDIAHTTSVAKSA